MAVRRAQQISPRRKVLSALVALAFSGATLANPTGPAAVSGSATFATVGKTLTVTNTPSAILNWQGFSIGTGETTRFVQQSTSSSVLNRVVGQDPSAILGTLRSNGRVFLLNPNGIVFGAGSRVDVAGLVASTLNLSNQDFLAGRLNFEAGAVANPILNYGKVITPAGGRVYLIAPNVENHGVISTPQGQTILAAGRSVQLVEADVPNLRVEVQAGGEALNVGQIIAKGGAAGIYAGLINQRGIVRADAVSRDATGRIVFRASGAAILDSGSVTSASGGATGGTVDVQADVLIHTGSIHADGAQGGSVDVQARNMLSAGRISADGSQGVGGEVNVQAAGRILQTSAAHLSADGKTGGGKVTLQAADRVFGSGTLTATGQGAGSTGGEIKVLGNEIVLLGASLDASGDAGGGTVLIGGDFQGKNSAIQNAATNWINFSTTIKADAKSAGDGGKVIVWSDRETQFYGSISARGGAASGDGGFIEVSGKENLVFGGMADAGAPNGKPGTLLLDPKFIVIDSAGGGALSSFLLADPNPFAGDQFADDIIVLPNGNIVATDWRDSFVATNAGAVYLFNGATGALISTISGGTANDNVGRTIDACGEGCLVDAIKVLNNGNFLVSSGNWDNPVGPAVNAGAVTFGNANTGFIGGSGLISASNSLIGTTLNDRVGGNENDIIPLPSGNYLVRSAAWSNPVGPVSLVGAVTFGSGTSGVSGAISAANSLVGSTASDQVGNLGVTVLTNGNYVVGSPSWDNAGVLNAGAVTFGSGTSGVSGVVSAANSLVGSTASDAVGNFGVTALSNGNYVVPSPFWDNAGVGNAGAVTFGSGTIGVSGAVSAANSLVGSTPGDSVGSDGVIALTNGNYVVRSFYWNNAGALYAGAVTFGSGTTGVSGVVSAANSLVGSTPDDRVGNGGVTVLSNGNYLVHSSQWTNGGANFAGAVTFGSGTSGVSGAVSAANSLVGSTASDFVGDGGVTVLSNGNYVVRSPFWDNAGVGNAGAVTFGSGTTGVSGAVSAANSLVGSTANDRVGASGVTALSNGNYVVSSVVWDNAGVVNAGAATFGSGTSGVSGVVSAANSLVGSTLNDGVGSATALSNGNYVVRSPSWDNAGVVNAGAATFGSGTSGVSGVVSAANSLVGSTAGDQVGFDSVTALANGNYVVRSQTWNNGLATQAGAVTFGNGTTGVSGAVSAANSLVGSTAFDSVGNNGVTALSNGNYVVRSGNWKNGAATLAGAVTWVNGTNGHAATEASPGAVVSAANSLVGTAAFDQVGSGGVTALTNGNYVVSSPSWNGAVGFAGAVTFGSGTTGVSGAVSTTNSLVGTTVFDQVGSGGVTALANGNYVVISPGWDSNDFGAVTWVNGTNGRAAGEAFPGAGVSAANSLVGTSNADGQGDAVGSGGIMALTNGNYVVLSPSWNIDSSTEAAGAVTFGNGTTGIFGAVSAANSLVGTTAFDRIGNGGVTPLSNGNVVVQSPLADATFVDAGLVHVLSLGGGTLANPLAFSDNAAISVTITPAQITAITNTGTAVVLQANTDLTLAASSPIVTTAGGAGGAITLQAGRSVLLNSNITTDNGNLTITANDPGAQAVNRDAGVGGVTIAADIDVGIGTLTASGGAGGVTFTGTRAITSTHATNGFVVIGAATIDAGDLVSLNAKSTIGTLTLSGGMVAGTGSLSVTNAYSGAGGSINLGGAVAITQASGDLIVNNAITGNGVSLVATAGSVISTSAVILGGVGGLTLSAGGATGDVVLTNGLASSLSLTSVSGRDLKVLSVAAPATLQGASMNVNMTRDVIVTGGTFGGAVVQTTGGAQTIAASNDITLNVGGTGVFTDAVIRATGGPQTVSAGGTLALTGGTGGDHQFASMQSNFGQWISAASIQLTGGSNGAFAGGNVAELWQNGAGSAQTINVTGGGTLSLQGGTGNRNQAHILNDGTSQTINFPAGGTLLLTGGSGGFGNAARISAQSGTQTIQGSAGITNAPVITLQGGGAGGIFENGNEAAIEGHLATQNIYAASLTLAGGTGFESLALIGSEAAQTLTVSGLTQLTGGSGTDAFAAIGQNDSGANIILNSTGGVSLQGGTGTASGLGAFAFIGTPGSNTANVSITSTGGSITLAKGASGGMGDAQIGSPLGGGTLQLTGTGVNLNDGQVKTTGSVILTATAGAISQSATGYLGAGSLTTNSSGATSLLGTANQIGGLDATTTGGALTVVNSGSLGVLGISTGANAVNLTAAGAISQTGAIASTGSLTTSSVGGTVLAHAGNAVSGFNAANTGGGDIELGTSAGSLTVSGVSQSGGDVFIENRTGGLATTGAISAPGNNTLVALAASNGSLSVGAPVSSDNVDLEAAGTASDVLINAGVTASLGDVFVSADRNVVLGAGGISAPSGHVTVAAMGGSFTESGAGIINSAVLDIFSAGATTLNNVNMVGGFSAVTGAGGVSFNNGAGFTLNGVSAPGNSVTLIAAGPIGNASAGVQANSLGATAVGGIDLGSGNLIEVLSLTNTGGGAVVFNNSAPTLTISGISQAGGGGVTIGNNGAITTSGAVGGDGSLLLVATGPMSVGGSITSSGGPIGLAGSDMIITGSVGAGAGTVTLSNTSGGPVSLGAGASGFGLSNAEFGNITAAALVLNGSPVATDGAVSLSGFGQVSMNGSSISIGHDFSVSGGNLALNAGDVSIVAGALPVAVNADGIAINGALSLTGGTGAGAHALVSGGAGGVTVDAGLGTISLVAGAGTDANAAVVSIGPIVVNGVGCTGCAVLATDPFASPPTLAATGLYGFPVSGTALAPVIIVIPPVIIEIPPVIVEIPIPPPPPQVLPPFQQQTGAPPAPEPEPESLSGSATGTAGGTTPVDDGAGTRRRRVPRC